MLVEIWSDIMCPWCAVGKARFETALADFAHRDEITVRWRSFELNRDAAPEVTGDYVQRLADKYGRTRAQAQGMIDQMTATGKAHGLNFRFDIARPGNTFDAHRLLHLAAEVGLQDALKTRLLAAYLTEGEAVGLPEVLTRLSVEVGLDPGQVADVLASDRFAEAVRADEYQAQLNRISGVPFFAIDKKYGLSGAQPPGVILQALEAGWEARELASVEAAEGCDDAGCEIP